MRNPSSPVMPMSCLANHDSLSDGLGLSHWGVWSQCEYLPNQGNNSLLTSNHIPAKGGSNSSSSTIQYPQHPWGVGSDNKPVTYGRSTGHFPKSCGWPTADIGRWSYQSIRLDKVTRHRHYSRSVFDYWWSGRFLSLEYGSAVLEFWRM